MEQGRETARMMKKRLKSARKFTTAYALLAGFILALVILIVLARAGTQTSVFISHEATRAILQDAEQLRAERTVAAEQARKALPPNGVLKAGWDYRPILKALEGGGPDPLICLVTSLVHDTAGLSEASKAETRKALEDSRDLPADNPFRFHFTPEDLFSEELVPRLCRFLGQSQALREMEEALKAGLLEDISTAYHDPLESCLVKVVVLFAGRSSCELADGDAPRALETLLAGYDLADLLADWTHVYGFGNRYYADRVLDKVLWRLVDTGSVRAEDRERILAALDARKSTDRFANALKTHAANLEIGEESDRRGYPDSVDLVFAVTGRGALEAANRLVALLDTPPYRVREQLASIGEHKIAGYWVNRFVDSAVQAYKMHARESLTGDMTRIAFALKDWQQAHGVYPASLEELQPFPLTAMPVEPLTGDPIRYQTDGGSFQLIGANDGMLWEEPYWVSAR